MKTTLFFSDGSSLELFENDLISGVFIRDNNDKYADMSEKEQEINRYNFPMTTKYNGPFELWSHAKFGLAPQVTEILANYFFFYKSDDPDTLYSSNNVVRIETK
ncbi:hypothetical protein FH621_01685 [Latilactobacillus curvatus]|uniref:hypothetical protein n=1 Tax=Latilactobacillus curvatus TaxID=28038 RepID=UPI00217D9BF2|nr:hypothetical protein [Latilactobacillus curvatus]MCS6142273.1 hypothetical protein [Latilactobacillus curvatus]